MTIGMFLKTLRMQKGMTQEEVAAKVGIAHNTYVRYENDMRKPKLDSAVKLAEFYGVTTAELLAGEPIKKEPADRPAPTKKEIMFALFKGAEGITDEDYEDVLRYAEFIKDKKRK